MQTLLSPEWDVKPATHYLWLWRGHTGPFARVRIKVSECQPSPTLVVEFCLSRFYNSLIWKTWLPLPQTQLRSAAGAECLLLSTQESVSALLVLTHEHIAREALGAYSWLHLTEMLYGRCVCAYICTSICADIFYVFFCSLIYTDRSCAGAWKISSLGQNIPSSRKVFLKVYKVCKNIY